MTVTQAEIIPETRPFCGYLTFETLEWSGCELVVTLGRKMNVDACLERSALEVHLGSDVLGGG